MVVLILLNTKNVYLNQPEHKLVKTRLMWTSDCIHVDVMVLLVHSGAGVTTVQHEGNNELL